MQKRPHRAPGYGQMKYSAPLAQQNQLPTLPCTAPRGLMQSHKRNAKKQLKTHIFPADTQVPFASMVSLL